MFPSQLDYLKLKAEVAMQEARVIIEDTRGRYGSNWATPGATTRAKGCSSGACLGSKATWQPGRFLCVKRQGPARRDWPPPSSVSPISSVPRKPRCRAPHRHAAWVSTSNPGRAIMTARPVVRCAGGSASVALRQPTVGRLPPRPRPAGPPQAPSR
jgi:hypothetical protein